MASRPGGLFLSRHSLYTHRLCLYSIVSVHHRDRCDGSSPARYPAVGSGGRAYKATGNLRGALIGQHPTRYPACVSPAIQHAVAGAAIAKTDPPPCRYSYHAGSLITYIGNLERRIPAYRWLYLAGIGLKAASPHALLELLTSSR